MEFLDKTGVATLWNKIKEYVGNETKKYLPLSGGTMTGTIVYENGDNTTLCSINSGGGIGWISCKNANLDINTDILGGVIQVYKSDRSDTEPRMIYYQYDNIYIVFNRQDNTERKYKFNIQKLIDDGYLIEVVEE